MHSVMYKVQ